MINNKKKLTRIMDAAIEDAFDNCKTLEDMAKLREAIMEKMKTLYNVRYNNDNEVDGELD